MLDAPLPKCVVYLDPEEYKSTWLGNKSIYRTRMAIADGGELLIIAPGVDTFGEDPEIDALIRKYGYRTTPETLEQLNSGRDLMKVRNKSWVEQVSYPHECHPGHVSSHHLICHPR